MSVPHEQGPPPLEPKEDAVLSKEDSFTNFLKDTLATTTHENRPKGAVKRKAIPDRAVVGITTEGADENLGENFEDTPWLPPSIDKAIEFRKKSIYHGGEIRIESLNLVSAPDLGSGTTLYFQFAFTMSICLFVMSVLSLPALVFIYSGTGVKQEDQDAFGLYKYTLGNIGTQNYKLPESRCTSGSYAYNDTCIHYDGNEITVSEAASVMTAMEFLQIFVFIIGIVYLQHKSFSVTGRNSKSQTAIADYTVQVHNIPPDTKDWQLLQHFSDLYGLDKMDWKGRPVIQGAYPVVDVSNTDNGMHVGSWVAECTLHKGIGSFIASFKDKQYLMEKLYRCRAQMKMYAENSPHQGGHKLNRYLAAEQRMLNAGALIDKLTEHTIKKKKLRILVSNDDGQVGSPGRPKTPGSAAEPLSQAQRFTSTQQISNPNSIYRNIDAPAVSAYITFQYAESRARCLEDYERYSTFPYSLFYPQPLMYRGYKLKVEKAPEPDQIVWENLEVSGPKKVYMRGRTAVIAVLLVILSFIVILQAAIYKNLFADSIPANEICESVIPTLYANGSSSINIQNMMLTRPPENQRIAEDSRCDSVGGDLFYGVYTTDGDYSNPVGKYDISACIDVGLCPSIGQSTFCPCFSTKSSQKCLPAGCDQDDTIGTYCKPFEASSMGICYCYSALNDGLSADGVVDTLQKLDSSEGDQACANFYKEYSLSVGLTYASVATTTIANLLLRTYLKALSKQEAHTSSDEEQGSIMRKVFQSSYVMMAIIVLIAYGRSSGTPKILQDLRIFVGPYDDFTRAWYGNIGFYLMTTFIIQSFSPLVFNLFMHFVGKPLQRYYHHDQVRTLRSTSVVMQHDLNMLEVGPVFDSTTHTAHLLTLLFFAMTFAPGLPLLMPLCCFAFVMYFRIDKYLLCRFYQKPPQLGDAAIRIVIAQLPWAAVIRLAFACWMLGNHTILPDEEDLVVDADTDTSSVRAHIARDNTLPLLILMALIIAAKTVLKIFEYIPIVWVFKVFFIICSEMESSKKQAQIANMANNQPVVSVHPWELVKTGDLNRQQVAPFTGEYVRFIKHKDEIPDTCMQMCSYAYLTNIEEAELEDGWEIRHQGDFVIKVKIWRDVKKRSKHRRGDLKKTFEVIADHRCATYNIERIPAYVIPMQGLREGTMSMMENQIREKQDKNVIDSMLYDAFDAGNLESNVVANYQKRKTGSPADLEAANECAAQRRAKRNAYSALEEDEDEDEEEGNEADMSDEKVNKAVKPKPTIQTKVGRGVAVDNAQDSFYFPHGATTPHAPPLTSKAGSSEYSYSGFGSTPATPHSHGVSANSIVAGSISALTAAPPTKYGAPPTPAYLAPDEGELPPQEVHKPYFPKRRAAEGASADSADSSDHKPYFPPSRSGDSSYEESGGRKKKKDKKHKHKKEHHEVEMAPVRTPHTAAVANSYAQVYGDDDDEAGYAYGGGDYTDYDDAGGVSGLV